MKKIFMFTLIIALFGLNTAFNQQVYKLTIIQPPPLTITISEAIDATVGEVVNLDTLFHVEGDISYDRVWKFWNGELFQTIDNPILTLTHDGVFYLTLIDENGCKVIDSIALDIVTNIDNFYPDQDHRQSVHVYPNPNTGAFDILISDCLPGCSIQIINSLGVQLLNRVIDCNNNEYSGTILMPTRESGTYFLVVKKDNKIIYKQKVIISIKK